MITLMNHREIEYHAHKIWESLGISMEAEVKELFAQWEMDSQRISVLELMDWLEARSKSVFTDELLLDYGCDCLRLYLLFEKTPRAHDPYLDTWEECSLEGLYKFLGKYRRLILATTEWNRQGGYQNAEICEMIQTVAQIQQDMLMHFSKGNTMPNRHNAISVLMTGINSLQKALDTGAVLCDMHRHDLETAVPQHGIESKAKVEENPEITKLCRELVILLAPFAPCLAEDLWQILCNEKTSVLQCTWKYQNIERQMIALPVQINGRTRRVLQVSSNMAEEACTKAARDSVFSLLEPDEEYRCIYVKNKIVNFVKNSEK